MPDPNSGGVQQPGGERLGQKTPGPANVIRLCPLAHAAAPLEWKREEKRGQWSRKHQQRSCREHQDFMLDHVRRKKHLAEWVQRRNKRNRQERPTAPEIRLLATSSDALNVATSRIKEPGN